MRLLALLCLVCAAHAVEPVSVSIPTARDYLIASIIGDARLVWIAPTGSMRPAIDEHNVVLVRRIPWSMVKVGDVIIFEVPPFAEGGVTYHSVIHRVWRFSSGHTLAVTKGDHNDSIDWGYVTEATYDGTVVAVLREP